MKYLKSFESKLKTINYKDMTNWGSTDPVKEFKPVDIEYIKVILADFIDGGATISYDEHYKGSNNIEYIRINIKDPYDGEPLSSIDSAIEYNKKYGELFEEIKVCTERIKMEFPNVEFKFYDNDGYDPIGGNKSDRTFELIIINKL